MSDYIVTKLNGFSCNTDTEKPHRPTRKPGVVIQFVSHLVALQLYCFEVKYHEYTVSVFTTFRFCEHFDAFFYYCNCTLGMDSTEPYPIYCFAGQSSSATVC